MKQRGGIAFDLLMAAGVLAVLVAGVKFLIGYGEDRANAKHEAANQKARAERTVELSKLKGNLKAAEDGLAAVRAERDEAQKKYQREREKRLHEFIPQDALASSCITVGFVRYHDAAAAGVPLGVRPEPGVAKAPAGVGTDAAAEVIARNYDKYRDCRAKVAGILEEFDAKKAEQNTVVDRINQRIQRAERKVQ